MSDISQPGGEEPSEKTLDLIKAWDYDDHRGLMEFVRDVWMWPEWGFCERDDAEGEIYELHTGGWSGNEQIIGALQSNTMFWLLRWESSRRGGHYCFKIRNTSL